MSGCHNISGSAVISPSGLGKFSTQEGPAITRTQRTAGALRVSRTIMVAASVPWPDCRPDSRRTKMRTLSRARAIRPCPRSPATRTQLWVHAPTPRSSAWHHAGTPASTNGPSSSLWACISACAGEKSHPCLFMLYSVVHICWMSVCLVRPSQQPP